MAFFAVSGPFDFALTTSRFRAYGVDRTNLWHEGGLHHAVGGREVRIEAAPGGVDVEPLDAETEPVVRALLGLAFDLEPFYAWAPSIRRSRQTRSRCSSARSRRSRSRSSQLSRFATGSSSASASR
jgi:hypothetical protein